ncbi:cyclophilin-like family protein [Halalkalicoccus sp. NIPERK01]|uniref:cyclophilin-like family protein n=1 Tax=Halalkalicoccus sp. NIPERK01 TaxID=3053469 RepID=UPI00256F5E3D|nr:cyclophilin-like family protein [Halalkalicoccus sp. NIPERK01]MDL5363776.1 cyclophilin-like family protein [Halalkalicoccus sp. NIPERK01]
MPDILIQVGEHECTADWTDHCPETRAAIEAALPLAGDGQRWGDELYFRTEVDVGTENERTEVPPGAVAYWPQGNAICLFWGPTPVSRCAEPRAASPVNLIARIDDTTALSGSENGTRVRLTEL